VSRIAISALFLLLAVPAACGGRSASGDSLTDQIAQEEGGKDVTVHIVSHNPRDANIYLYLGSSRQRLGLAGGHSTTTFTIPWGRLSSASQVHLRAEVIGDQTRVDSDPLQVTPGGSVVWTLQADLSQSIDMTYQ
jgi:hypothetical protein